MNSVIDPLVREVMTPDPLVVKSNATVLEAARMMAQRNVGSAIVAEDGRVSGILTERDLMKRVVAAGLALDTPVRKVMTAPVETVQPGTPLSQAAHMMALHRFRHLPVTERGRVVGVISDRDILAISPALFELARNEWSPQQGGGPRLDTGQCENCEILTDRLHLIQERRLCDDCLEELAREQIAGLT